MSYVKVHVKEDHFERLTGGSEITGRPVQSLIDEALAQYIECDLSALVEDLAGNSSQA